MKNDTKCALHARAEEKKPLYSAHCRDNGIVFDSVECPLLQVESAVNEKGEIEAKVIPGSIGTVKHYRDCMERIDKNNQFFRYAFIALRCLGFVIITLLTKNIGSILAWAYFCILVSGKWLELVENRYVFDYNTKRISKRPYLKFHAAEHMACNFYRAYKRVPTMEEIKKASRFSEHCGSYTKLYRLMVDTLVSLYIIVFLPIINNNFTVISILTYFIMFIVIHLGTRKLYENGSLKFLEVLVTEKPTDLELKCAIKGLEVFDDLEKHIVKNPTSNMAMAPIVLTITFEHKDVSSEGEEDEELFFKEMEGFFEALNKEES